ncbi:MAG: hypothetical protein HQK60_01425 [Deltaproteobacteria bacterium]|nr:hypothetical protein [Deltaproteobacteria bacterium]
MPDPDKVIAHVRRLKSVYDVTIENIDGFSRKLDLNLVVLRHCVECYLKDLDRINTFNEIDLGRDKIMAACTMKWVAQLRPIQIRPAVPSHEIDSRILFANEILATYAGLNYLKANFAILPKRLVNNLVHILHYSRTQGEPLALLLHILEKSLGQKGL